MTDRPNGVQWSDSLLVGHADIDEEHKGIFAFAAELREIDAATAPPSLASETIYKLLEYASTHLGREEELMRRYHYPYMNGHAIEHGKFLSHLTTIIYDYERGRDNVLQNCSDFVTRWLETHILVNDVELANFLRHRGL